MTPATINRYLGNIRAVLNVAQEWGHIQVVPKFRMVKQPKKLPNYVTAEHFQRSTITVTWPRPRLVCLMTLLIGGEDLWQWPR